MSHSSIPHKSSGCISFWMRKWPKSLESRTREHIHIWSKSVYKCGLQNAHKKSLWKWRLWRWTTPPPTHTILSISVFYHGLVAIIKWHHFSWNVRTASRPKLSLKCGQEEIVLQRGYFHIIGSIYSIHFPAVHICLCTMPYSTSAVTIASVSWRCRHSLVTQVALLCNGMEYKSILCHWT